MTLLQKAVALGVLLLILIAAPNIPEARVMMTGSIHTFGMDIIPSASFTVEDFTYRKGLFTINIVNDPAKTVKYAKINIEIRHSSFGTVLTGILTVVNENRPDRSFLGSGEMLPGQVVMISNTMIAEKSDYMSSADWSEEFKDEVLRVGALPEGTYTMRFSLSGYYDSPNDPIEEGNEIDSSMEIRNPTPPELITPDDMSDDTVTVPRFAWQRPLVSDFTNVNPNSIVQILYNIKVWRMFGEDGSAISEEDAINRIPIWEVDNLPLESADFDPGTAWEELMPGRKYCWQVLAIDSTGRPITQTNDGKSDVWQFTCQFSEPVLNEPFGFYPFNFSWTPARAGGGVLYYRVRIADNADFAGAFEEDGVVMTNFRYPQDAQSLRLGETYYLELQATDDSGIPIGEPAVSTFIIPVDEVTLMGPADGSTPSSSSPSFSWQGTSPFYVVTITDPEGGWSYMSGTIEDTRWIYDGEDLIPGTTYSWNVSPASDDGEPVGDSSDSWTFTLAAAGQVTLVSPVNEEGDSLTPTFTWSAFESSTQGSIDYTIVIEDDSGTALHSATVSATSYQYPVDAPELEYAKRYMWSVNAEQNSAEVGTRSEQASFTTPLAEAGTTAASMEEISDMVKVVLGSYPQFADFEEKILISISDETGPMTPSAFMELFETFKITSVTAE